MQPTGVAQTAVTETTVAKTAVAQTTDAKSTTVVASVTGVARMSYSSESYPSNTMTNSVADSVADTVDVGVAGVDGREPVVDVVVEPVEAQVRVDGIEVLVTDPDIGRAEGVVVGGHLDVEEVVPVNVSLPVAHLLLLLLLMV